MYTFDHLFNADKLTAGADRDWNNRHYRENKTVEEVMEMAAQEEAEDDAHYKKMLNENSTLREAILQRIRQRQEESKIFPKWYEFWK